MRRVAIVMAWAFLLALGLAGLFLVMLAIPVTSWRSGRTPAPPLELVEGGPSVSLSRRIWIDTDVACGLSRTTDPDDCLAILLLARSAGIEIAGISTVYGNASLEVTDETARALVAVLGMSGAGSIRVYRGAGEPDREGEAQPPAPALVSLRRALEAGPLTIVSLGPLTNIAAALGGRPDLQANVSRLVAVMGRRPGHLFHPAEGSGGGMLFGHGPVFRDLNFIKDPAAAARVMAMPVPMTLVPYDAARRASLTDSDLERIAKAGPAAQWVAARAKGWLDFWRQDVGRLGFYPFDLAAAAYVLDTRLFNCATVSAWVAIDRSLWSVWFYSTDALLVEPKDQRPEQARAARTLIYCPEAQLRLHDWFLSQLTE